MRCAPARISLTLLVLAACSAPTPSNGGGARPPRLGAKLSSVPTETLGVVFEVQASERSRAAIRAWFLEAIGQSSKLDLDPDHERPARIVLRGRSGQNLVLTTTLVRPEQAPLPLAGVRAPTGRNPAAIDELARETRATLGESSADIQREQRPCEAIVSANERVAADCSAARRLVRRARLRDADAKLRAILSRDGACALALSMRAAVQLDLGRADRAISLASRSLELELRASHATKHRAARTLLIANGSDPKALIELGEEALRTRPRDAQARFTRALGLSLAERWDEAAPTLESLLERLPDWPGVLYCLGHARLARGQAELALELMPRVRARVPRLPASRLEAWILLELGRHDQLSALLDALAREPAFRIGRGQLTLLGMRAAHALLQGKDDAAARHLLEQLDRLRSVPRLEVTEAATMLDACWVLARIGHVEAAQRALAALRGQSFEPLVRPSGMVASAVLRLGGGQGVDEARLRHITNAGLERWRQRIEARVALGRGRPERALLLLRDATKDSEDPSILLELAEAERAAGKLDEALRIARELSDRLLRPRLLQPALHALVRPKLALVQREAKRLVAQLARR